MSLERGKLIEDIVTAFGVSKIKDDDVKADIQKTAEDIAIAIDTYVKGIVVKVPSNIAVTVNDGVVDIEGATTEDVTAEIS